MEDYHLDEPEEDFESAKEEAICHDAAILILEGYSRDKAVRKAEEIFLAQQEAEADVTGVKATLDEAQSPRLKKGTEKQVAAIAAELRQERN